tara:strand:- start:67 stop:225 length:159 start_codon:yes stop_codon:yes gene_type:complete
VIAAIKPMDEKATDRSKLNIFLISRKHIKRVAISVIKVFGTKKLKKKFLALI